MVDYNFLFVWCPGHSGIKQNDLVDILAKSGTALNHITNIKESLVERNTKVRKDCVKRWQREWDEVSVPLHDLKPILGRWISSSRNNRREEVVLCRMRLDTCLFSVKHHFDGSARAECNTCNVEMTVKHIIIECPKFNVNRRLLMDNHNYNLNQILGDEYNHDKLFKFVRDIGYYNIM